jgi:hypothetical protein
MKSPPPQKKEKTAGSTLFDHKRNEKILEELNVGPVEKKLRRYK